MATIVRQPFAPLDGSRLQNLTSLKNRQNAIPPNSAVKRKASEVVDGDDSENVDPLFFAKRSKGGLLGHANAAAQDLGKPSSFVLTKAAASPLPPALPKDALKFAKPTSSASRMASARSPRAFLQPKSPAAKLNTAVAKSSPMSAPAGRSPTRGSKRVGILGNRRRTAGPFGRVDPPSFGLGGGAPFSLDAALKGTIPSYAGSSSSSPASRRPDAFASLDEPDLKSSWFFDIHEDSPEQEMTNLLQHGTCTLDISSDEESELKARRDRAEGRDKENVPPPDDVSQTRSRAAARRVVGAATVGENDMVVDKARGPLLEMNAADYYAEGCDETSVVIVDEDDDEDDDEVASEEDVVVPPAVVSAAALPTPDEPAGVALPAKTFDFSVDHLVDSRAVVEELMGKDEPAAKAAVLEPVEGTGESFELWESGSAKDETEETRTRDASPCPAAVESAVQQS
ncbi:hypothetical protein VTK73DRAFT_1295 [Phialemonium thermophilum]|uniref:Thymidylate kinase n=1 Tax=Phialemonium thermophilum TaxID=223376 RepID=A0ABR3VTR6_9PEZI